MPGIREGDCEARRATCSAKDIMHSGSHEGSGAGEWKPEQTGRAVKEVFIIAVRRARAIRFRAWCVGSKQRDVAVISQRQGELPGFHVRLHTGARPTVHPLFGTRKRHGCAERLPPTDTGDHWKSPLGLLCEKHVSVTFVVSIKALQTYTAAMDAHRKWCLSWLQSKTIPLSSLCCRG